MRDIPMARCCEAQRRARHGDIGGGQQGRVKAQRDVDDDDPCGRRHLLVSIFMALLVLPRLEHRGNPRAGLRFVLRRGCIVSSLGRCLGGFVDSLVRVLEWTVAAAQSVGFQGATYTRSRWRSMVDEFSGRVRPRCSLVDLLDAN
jgi:hypothetical protein